MPDEPAAPAQPDTPAEPTETPAEASPAPPEPGLIAGKYKTADEFSKGFGEAMKLLGFEPPSPDKPLYGEGGHFRDIDEAVRLHRHNEKLISRAAHKTPLKIDADQGQVYESTDAFLEGVGIDIESVVSSVRDTGDIPKELREKLSSGRAFVAVDPDTLRDYFSGVAHTQAATVEECRAELIKTAGDEATFKAVFDWAAKSGSGSESVAFYNELLESGASPQRLAIVFGRIVNEHKAYVAAAQTPEPVVGSAPGSVGGGGAKPFESSDEMQAELRKLLEKNKSAVTDPGFMARMAVTKESVRKGYA